MSDRIEADRRRDRAPVHLSLADHTFWIGLAAQAAVFGAMLYVSVSVLQVKVEAVPKLSEDVKAQNASVSKLNIEVTRLTERLSASVESNSELLTAMRRENQISMTSAERRFAALEAQMSDLKEMREKLGAVDQRSQRSYENINRLFDIARENQGKLRALSPPR